MNTKVAQWICLWIVITAIAAGCATHRVDWNSRIGTYTFDQAVTELGPPDKQAKLSTGQLVAEWVNRYYNGSTTVVGGGFYGYPAGVGVIQTTPTYYETRFRLTFDTNNVLIAWSRH